MKNYESKFKTKEITASSRLSININKSYYTFEASETRQAIDDDFNISLEWEDLWKSVHEQVDKQAEDAINAY